MNSEALFLGKHYLITGASAGIGRGFAEELHLRGATLTLVARREDRLAEISKILNERRTDSVKYYSVDLGNDSELSELLAKISTLKIDGLVNNAGFGSFGRFEELSIDRECEMFRVNVEAPLCLTHAAVPHMKEQGFGVIINLASIAAFQPLPYMATYAATKTANYSYSLAHHHEFKEYGIRVLAVCPGPIPTEFGDVAGVPGKFEETPSDSVRDVVLSALKGVERNFSIVVPGFWGKLLSSISILVPRKLNLYLAGISLKRKL